MFGMCITFAVNMFEMQCIKYNCSEKKPFLFRVHCSDNFIINGDVTGDAYFLDSFDGHKLCCTNWFYIGHNIILLQVLISYFCKYVLGATLRVPCKPLHSHRH